MSKLARYKKPPAIKLPLPPRQKKNPKKECVIGSNDDDDDDFQAPSTKPTTTITKNIKDEKKNNNDDDKQDGVLVLGEDITSISTSSNNDGYHKTNNNNKAPLPPPAAPPPARNRKKKQDPELELAIALSESLHQDVERLKEKENDFIVSNNLQQEIELRQLVKLPETKPPPPSMKTVGNKRKRKVNLAELPLYKTSEEDKKIDIERRLNMILDEAEFKAFESKQVGEFFYIRDILPIRELRLPHRLKDCVNTSSTCLWSMSKSEISTRDAPEIYVTKSVAECKRLAEETARKLNKIKSIPPDNEVVDSPSSHHPNANKENKSLTGGGAKILKSLSPKNKMLEEEEVVKKVRPTARQYPTSAKVDDSTTTTNSQQQQVLIKDLLQMFVSKEAADVTAYGREEKPIKCHKFILMARSRKLYSEIVQVTNQKGISRNVIALTCFSHLAVKAFIKFLYCGKLKDLEGQDLEDALELGARFDIKLPSPPQQSDNETSPVAAESNNNNCHAIMDAMDLQDDLGSRFEQPPEPSDEEAAAVVADAANNNNNYHAMDLQDSLELELGFDVEIKSPPPLQQSQPQVTSDNTPLPLVAASSNNKNCHAMDYSTIDTPILKKELKRYGLKPLPRSKAKLILRHIDEEISKN